MTNSTQDTEERWRLIETAPLDTNVRVDLWGAERERYESERITDCHYRDGHWWHQATIYDDEEWVEKNNGYSPVYNVTHWQPRPEPPKAQQQ